MYRLQAIVSKSGNSAENTLWLLQHIRYMVLALKSYLGRSDFSVEGLGSNARTGNRGLVDVILKKKTALGHLLPPDADPSGDCGRLHFGI